MKYFFISLTSLVLVGVLSAKASIAADKTAPAKVALASESKPMARTELMEGRVAGSNTQSEPLTVMVTFSDGRKGLVEIDKTTVVVKKDKVVPFESIKLGERLRIEFVAKDGKNIAKTVEINEMDAKPAKPSENQVSKLLKVITEPAKQPKQPIKPQSESSGATNAPVKIATAPVKAQPLEQAVVPAKSEPEKKTVQPVKRANNFSKH